MTDITERLKAIIPYWPTHGAECQDAIIEIERLRDYACHKIGCAALHQMGAKCDCGLSELVGPREVSKP